MRLNALRIFSSMLLKNHIKTCCVIKFTFLLQPISHFFAISRIVLLHCYMLYYEDLENKCTYLLRLSSKWKHRLLHVPVYTFNLL